MAFQDLAAPSNEVECTLIRPDGRHEPERRQVLRECLVAVKVNGTHCMNISCTETWIPELVIGRLYSEGFLASIDDLEDLVFDEESKTVEVALALHEAPNGDCPVEEVPSTGAASPIVRRFVGRKAVFRPVTPVVWDPTTIFGLYRDFKEDTPLHRSTGGTHSSSLSVGGETVFSAEDIGRHNSLDKLIGYALLNGVDLTRAIVFTTGRIPSDMMSKVVHAGIPVIASKSAATDAALRMAREYQVTLIASVKDTGLRVLNGAEWALGSDEIDKLGAGGDAPVNELE